MHCWLSVCTPTDQIEGLPCMVLFRKLLRLYAPDPRGRHVLLKQINELMCLQACLGTCQLPATTDFGKSYRCMQL